MNLAINKGNRRVIEVISYLDESGQLVKSCLCEIEDAVLLKMYRTMCLTRHIDERMITLQRQGEISFALSSRGEEACAVASAAALEMCDWLYPQYREAGVMFWRGGTTLDYIHHMFGDCEDSILGRQMPNHFGSHSLNVVTVSSPIGTNIPHAAGCAYAMKCQKEEAVALCYFGDGATSEGDFYVGLNFAAVRKCPVIFFCRNNGYAISTPTSAQFVTEGVAEKGAAFGIPSLRVDGNDVVAIYDVVQKARAACLRGEGPQLIEAMTYRLGAHSTSDDPTQYRKNEEVKAWEKKCPILRLRRYLESRKLWNEEKENALLESVAGEVSAAIALAKETSPPAVETLIQDVYHEIPKFLSDEIEGMNDA